MRDARDAEDKRLLETGEIDLLLAGWVETIRGQLRREDARRRSARTSRRRCASGLWRELKAGKHRDGKHPFRVIVHSVIGWVCKRLVRAGLARERVLRPRRRGTGRDGRLVIVDVTLEQFVATLPPGDGEVARALLPGGPRARRDRRAPRQEAERRLPGDQPEQGEAAGSGSRNEGRARDPARRARPPPCARRAARRRGHAAEGRRPRRRAGAADRGVPRARPAPRAERRGARVRALARRPADAARPRREGAHGSTTSSTRSSRRARSNRTLGRRSGATTSSSRAAFSTHRASQRRCGTRSPSVLGRSRASLTAPSLGATPLRCPHVPGRPTLRAGRDADAVSVDDGAEPPDEVDALFLGDPS